MLDLPSSKIFAWHLGRQWREQKDLTGDVAEFFFESKPPGRSVISDRNWLRRKTMTRRLLFALLLTVCAPLSVLAIAADGETKTPADAATSAEKPDDQNGENDDDDEDVVQERHDNEAMKRLPPEQLFQMLKMRETRRIATATHDEPPAVAILVPLFFFIALLGVVGGTLWFRFRSERLRQETLRLMIDKGTEIPTAFFAPKTRAKDADMRRGVVLVAVGIGMALFIAIAMQQLRMATVGAVPILTGAGYLMVWRLQRRGDSSER